MELTASFQKYKAWFVWGLVLISVILVFIEWIHGQNIFEKLVAIKWVAACLLLSETLFTLGLILMAFSVGRTMAGNGPWLWPKQYRALRHDIKKISREMILKPLFTFGFWLNFVGAVITSMLLIYGIFKLTSYSGLGIILLIVIDLIATFGWRIPLQIARQNAKKSALIHIRQAKKEDLDAYMKLQSDRWLDENKASREDLFSRFKANPEGMLVAEQNSRIVGMVFAMQLKHYDYDNPPSWYEITNYGKCNNHYPKGNIMFGVDLTTARGVGGRAGDALLLGIGKLAISKNVKWCILGGRMPGYHNYKDEMTAEEYLWAKTKTGEFLDRQVRYYGKQPGLKIVKALPNYFHDPDSCDYGVLLQWRNPFYNWPFTKFWSSSFSFLFKLEERYVKLAKFVKPLIA